LLQTDPAGVSTATVCYRSVPAGDAAIAAYTFDNTTNIVRKSLLGYYGATILFLGLDTFFGLNVRIAFFDGQPLWKSAYYLVCFGCFALMLARPAWTVLIGAIESLVTLVALILNMAIRTIVSIDALLEGGVGPVTVAELINFTISGAAAYVAWLRGMLQLHRER